MLMMDIYLAGYFCLFGIGFGLFVCFCCLVGWFVCVNVCVSVRVDTH